MHVQSNILRFLKKCVFFAYPSSSSRCKTSKNKHHHRDSRSPQDDGEDEENGEGVDEGVEGDEGDVGGHHKKGGQRHGGNSRKKSAQRGC